VHGEIAVPAVTVPTLIRPVSTDRGIIFVRLTNPGVDINNCGVPKVFFKRFQRLLHHLLQPIHDGLLQQKIQKESGN
jgi:hypothetical protein